MATRMKLGGGVRKLPLLMSGLLLAASISSGAAAQMPASGQAPAKMMAAQCEKRIDPAVAMLGLAACTGFLDGVMSTHTMMVSFYGARPAYCGPKDGIPLARAVEVFVSYLRLHADDAEGSARQIALVALGEAYPCR